jgi:hypothetical protein
MGDQRQNFYRAWLIINSLFIPVFVLFFIEIFKLPFLFKSGIIFFSLIIASLKIYCMSGISGCILEIISGEEFVLQLRRVHQNAKDLWPGFSIVFVSILFVDFILFALFPSSSHIWRPLYFDLIGTIAAYVLARWAINKKYIRPLGIARRVLKLDPGFLWVIISACLLELVLVRVSGFVHIGNFHWRNISAFMLNYIHVFEFIFCALYILDGYPEITEKFNSRKEVFLINPMGTEVVQSIGFWSIRCYPPIFVVLKALSPKTYKFREFNQVLWHERYYKDNALVCITCFTSNCCEAYKIAKEFKKRGSKVIMGGPHVTYLPSEALTFCDSVVIGSAEGIWKEVLRDYENGTLKLQYKGPATEADYHQVHQELLNSPPSVAKSFLETSRGCKFRCHFCTIPALSGGQVRLQSINDMVDLIKKVKSYDPNIRFLDSNIYSDPAYSRELFMALKPLNIRWQSSCTIDIAKNQETLKLARESGCDRLAIGYEISGGSFEKSQHGKFSMAQKYLEYTNITKKAGIKIKGLFIFGFDSDNYSALIQLWKFCFSVMPQFTVLSILTPLPGSGVYRDMLNQDRIINLNWRSYGFIRMVVRHPHMDHRLMSFFFPLIQTLFFLTTSSGGIMLLVFCYAIPLWIASMTFR